VDAVVDVLVERRSDHERKRCECHVIKGDVPNLLYNARSLPFIEEGLSAESVEESEEELRHSERHVLIEEVQDHLRYPDVTPVPMHQKQSP
jgi:hypothetical protein